ncbi:ubiquitin-like protein Pup [Demequina sediminicola]|uniref:ubiquitin-like protein Pup n=1 Tax=Demequina sediminicola TaxID=1095026 RepID=UPI0007823EEA|nr:ubiquitin-like protein Pup [Demequina sediminicola]
MPQTHSSSHGYEDDAPEPMPAPAKAESTDALDSLLDEIDDSLQTNAEEFVRSFVQKGGQ